MMTDNRWSRWLKYYGVLKEYPEFVHHCHILKHEDNEMMRSIISVAKQRLFECHYAIPSRAAFFCIISFEDFSLRK